MDIKGKRLLLLGGTNSAEEIKAFAEKNGVILLATGPYKNTLLKRISDEEYDVDAMDTKALTKLLTDASVDGVFVGCNEDVVPHAIAAAEAAKLPCYCTHEQWDLCANKSKFKAMCRKYGVPVTDEYSYDNIKHIEFPVIAKPADSCGSQGFSVCYNEDELVEAYKKALPFSRTGNVLIEKYMPYEAVIIHYTLINGEIIFSGMSEKRSMKLKDYGSSVMALQVFPSAFTEKYLKDLNDKVVNMFKSEGLHDGPIWIEAFNNGGEFTFNEMGYRFGGSMTYYPIRYFHRFDQLEMMLRYSLEGETKEYSWQFLDNKPKGKKYSILPLHLNPGKIEKISGVETIKNFENLYTYVPIHFEGDIIKKTGTVSQVFCYLHILFDEMADLKTTIKKIVNTLSATDEKGDEMIFCLYDIDSL